jgi:hypothetical protein
MGTSAAKIRNWLMHASEETRWVIIVCDLYDHEDYPVDVPNDANKFWEIYDAHDRKNMQRIMEVYDLTLDIDMQMHEQRAYHMPSRPEKSVETEPVSKYDFTRSPMIW